MDPGRLESLPRDVLFYFALEFNLPTVFNLCRTSKTLNTRLCKSNEFWSQKLFHDYQIRYQDIGGKSKSKYIVRLLSQYSDPRFIFLLKGNKLKQDDLNQMLINTAMNGKIDIVKYLIEKGADVHAENYVAMRLASEHGHLDVIKYLIENGANIHADNDFALRYASQNGHLEVVKYLVEKGANIHALNEDALINASYWGYLPVVKYLVEKGANIHARNNRALHLANYMGHLPVVNYLKSL